MGGVSANLFQDSGKDEDAEEDDYIEGLIQVEPPGAYDFLWQEVEIKQVCTNFFFLCHCVECANNLAECNI